MRKEFGQNLTVSIYGESHSSEIGVFVTGMPEGEEFSRKELAEFMARRAPGQKGTSAISDVASTSRKEPDQVVFKSGIREIDSDQAALTGEELQGCIYNTNQ